MTSRADLDKKLDDFLAEGHTPGSHKLAGLLKEVLALSDTGKTDPKQADQKQADNLPAVKHPEVRTGYAHIKTGELDKATEAKVTTAPQVFHNKPQVKLSPEIEKHLGNLHDDQKAVTGRFPADKK